MRERAFRFLRNATVMLSLLLFVATAIICVRSFFVVDGLGHRRFWTIGGDSDGTPASNCTIESERGRATLVIATATFDDALPADTRRGHATYHWNREPVAMSLPGEHLGFCYDRTDTVDAAKDHTRVTMVAFPLYVPLVIFTVAPGLWLRKALRLRRRRRLGLCPQCGYDLRASPGCCPECGWS